MHVSFNMYWFILHFNYPRKLLLLICKIMLIICKNYLTN